MALSNDCDPAGDIVLKLGSDDEETLIRVHSKVLSLASPVFAAMLSPRFAEGQALEDNKGTVDSPTVIDLPDDDPKAISFICRLLHFNEDAAQSTSYPPFSIMRLAEICEKYDMSRALSPWSNLWMRDRQTIPPQLKFPENRFDRAWVSYALRRNKSFWRITREISRYSTPAELDIEHSLLPDTVLYLLRIQCKQLLKQLRITLESWVSPLLQCACDVAHFKGEFSACQHTITAGHYFRCLSRHRLWPISKIQTYSISQISRLVEMHGLPNDSSSGQKSLETDLRKAVHDVDKKITGQFLSCVRDRINSEKYREDHANLNWCCLSKEIAQRTLGW